MSRPGKGAPRDRGPRVNHSIRAPKVRVVGDDGKMLGVMHPREAMQKAESLGLDLVEISPNVEPPVCKIMDFGKFKYEQKKKSQSQKKQAGNVIKELTLSPVTQDHDLNVKVKKAISFLEDGNRVKFTLRFRGRQMAHPEIGFDQLKKIEGLLKEHAQIEVAPKKEGKFLGCVFAPLAGKAKAGKSSESSSEKKAAVSQKPS